MKNQTSQGTFVYDRKGKIKLVFSPLPRPTRIDLLQNSPYEFAQLVEQGFIDEDLCECAPMHLLDLEDLGVL